MTFFFCNGPQHKIEQYLENPPYAYICWCIKNFIYASLFDDVRFEQTTGRDLLLIVMYQMKKRKIIP